MDKKLYVSITVASRLTGVAADTIRAWERRYAAITPLRDDAGRRRFGPGELARLRLLGELTRGGCAIGTIAACDDRQLGDLANQDGGRPDGLASERLVVRLMSAVEAFSPHECDELLGLAMASLPTEQLIEGVIGPALREVGERWHCGEMSIAQERLLSGSVQRLVLSVINTLQGARDAPRLALATLPGERHELGLLFSALAGAKAGYQCVYLGCDVPVADIVTASRRSAASALALSVVMPDADGLVLTHLETLDQRLTPETEIWLGGRLAGEVTLDRLSARVTYLGSLTALHRRLAAARELHASATPLRTRFI